MSELLHNDREQSLILNNRKKGSLSGVEDIVSFDDETVVLVSVLGKLVIKGEMLKILSFTNETGDMEIEGKINAVVYLNDNKGKNSVIGKLFK